MKKYKSRLLSVIMILVLVVSFGTPALAVVSEYDQEYLTQEQQDNISDATTAWWDAYNAGDEQGMADAHAAAEAERSTENYSGGDDGSEYLPWGNDDSGGDDDYYYYTPATYTITATAGTGGSISPSGSSSVTEGNSKTYTIAANSGYTIANVKADGSSIGVPSTYAFSSVL